MRWGLIPSWAKETSIGNRLINARAETLADKPAFRLAFRQRRCLVVADGFYEWLKHGKAKQTYFIHRPDDAPFAFAGLWERWRNPQGEKVESCTVVTTDANTLVRPLHDRMPVILPREDYDVWLDPAIHEKDRLMELLRPCPDSALTLTPVGNYVNKPANEGPECLAPAADQLF
jgi:putative SOS response-associated peptidase YedK